MFLQKKINDQICKRLLNFWTNRYISLCTHIILETDFSRWLTISASIFKIFGHERSIAAKNAQMPSAFLITELKRNIKNKANLIFNLSKKLEFINMKIFYNDIFFSTIQVLHWLIVRQSMGASDLNFSPVCLFWNLFLSSLKLLQASPKLPQAFTNVIFVRIP